MATMRHIVVIEICPQDLAYCARAVVNGEHFAHMEPGRNVAAVVLAQRIAKKLDWNLHDVIEQGSGMVFRAYFYTKN